MSEQKMLWETLKKRIANYVVDHPEEDGSQHINAAAQSSGVSITFYLDNVDIRDVAKLRDLVPRAFPPYLRGERMLWVDVGERGWFVYKRST